MQQLVKVKDEELKGIKKALELKDSELQVLRDWKKLTEERQKAAEERAKGADSRLDTLEKIMFQKGG